MRKIQLFGLALSALLLMTVTTVNAFELTLASGPVDQAAHMIYDPGTGQVRFVFAQRQGHVVTNRIGIRHVRRLDLDKGESVRRAD